MANYKLGIFHDACCFNVWICPGDRSFWIMQREECKKKFFKSNDIIHFIFFVYISSSDFIFHWKYSKDESSVQYSSYWKGILVWTWNCSCDIICLSVLWNIHKSYGGYLYWKRRQNIFRWLQVLAQQANVVSNFILISEYSYMGAAISTLISYSNHGGGIYITIQNITE